MITSFATLTGTIKGILDGLGETEAWLFRVGWSQVGKDSGNGGGGPKKWSPPEDENGFPAIWLWMEATEEPWRVGSARLAKGMIPYVVQGSFSREFYVKVYRPPAGDETNYVEVPPVNDPPRNKYHRLGLVNIPGSELNAALKSAPAAALAAAEGLPSPITGSTDQPVQESLFGHLEKVLDRIQTFGTKQMEHLAQQEERHRQRENDDAARRREEREHELSIRKAETEERIALANARKTEAEAAAASSAAHLVQMQTMAQLATATKAAGEAALTKDPLKHPAWLIANALLQRVDTAVNALGGEVAKQAKIEQDRRAALVAAQAAQGGALPAHIPPAASPPPAPIPASTVAAAVPADPQTPPPAGAAPSVPSAAQIEANLGLAPGGAQALLNGLAGMMGTEAAPSEWLSKPLRELVAHVREWPVSRFAKEWAGVDAAVFDRIPALALEATVLSIAAGIAESLKVKA